MICVFGLFHGLVMLPAVLCMFGPTDEEPKAKLKLQSKSEENGHVPKENGHGPKTKHSKDSDKYLRENEQNLQTENQELGVPLTLEVTETLLEGNLRETVLL